MRNLNKRLLSSLSPRPNSTKISAAQPFRGRWEEEESTPGDRESFAIAEICTELASQVWISLQPRPPSSPVPSLFSPRGFGPGRAHPWQGRMAPHAPKSSHAARRIPIPLPSASHLAVLASAALAPACAPARPVAPNGSPTAVTCLQDVVAVVIFSYGSEDMIGLLQEDSSDSIWIGSLTLTGAFLNVLEHSFLVHLLVHLHAAGAAK
jgi:hypothetical protein